MDKNKYKDSQLIAKRIASVVNEDNKSVNEDKLSDFLKDTQSDYDDVMIKIINTKRVKKIYDKVSESDKDANIEKLISSIEMQQVGLNKSKNRFKILLSAKISVAVIILIAFIVYSLAGNESANIVVQENIIAENIYCEISEPVLIVESGDAIALSEITKEVSNVEVRNNNILYDKKNCNVDKTVKDIVYHTLIIPHKMNYTISLSDGTKITLNSGSKLKYPKSFENIDRRYVELEGEAYFDVAKSDIPFVIKSNDVYVKVYGTKLNINSYDRSIIETVLVKGVVGVTTKESKEVILSPNQLHTYNLKSLESEIKNVDTNNYTYWMCDDFIYTNTHLLKVLTDFERWYGVKFEYENNVIENINLSLNCLKTNDIETVLMSLERSINLVFINKGGGMYDIIKQ